MLGATVLASGDRAEAIALFEQGIDAAREAGVEAYLLRCSAPLAAATGSQALLAEATGLLERASIPADGAWLLGYEAYLSVASAWMDRGEPDRARATLQPLLTVAEREPWTPVLAAALVVDGRALNGLGNTLQARSALERAARLAAGHGMPQVLSDALAARQAL
jgi:tetratricopeptide (TPR) repeat protein